MGARPAAAAAVPGTGAVEAHRDSSVAPVACSIAAGMAAAEAHPGVAAEALRVAAVEASGMAAVVARRVEVAVVPADQAAW